MSNEVLALACLILTVVLLGVSIVASIGTPHESKATTKLAPFRLAEQLKWYAAEMNLRTQLSGYIDEEAMRVAIQRAAREDYTKQKELIAFRQKELKDKTRLLEQYYTAQMRPLA